MDFNLYLKKVMDLLEWDDEVVYVEDRDCHMVETTYTINGNTYRLYIECYDKSQLVKLFMYGPFAIPESRYNDCCILFSRINKRVYAGYLEPTNEHIRYLNSIDVEGFDPDPQMVVNMLNAAASAFSEKVLEAIGAIAYTKMKVDDIIAQYEQ